MLSQERYVTLSLELHLFFARIMKEHALFLEAGFTPQNVDFAREADRYKIKFEALLSDVVTLSDGIIRPNVLHSGEIITDFTLGAEQKTQNFTGIKINHAITRAESRLHSGLQAHITPAIFNKVHKLNKDINNMLNELISFKRNILNSVLSCSMFTANYPLLIEHVLREAAFYRDCLENLERGEDPEHKDLRQTELFWDKIMFEHALFIRGLLDPTENALIEAANSFAFDYGALIEAAQKATDAQLAAVTGATLQKTKEYSDFKAAGAKGIAECKIRSIILPLLADHVLREANHFIRILKMNT